MGIEATIFGIILIMNLISDAEHFGFQFSELFICFVFFLVVPGRTIGEVISVFFAVFQKEDYQKWYKKRRYIGFSMILNGNLAGILITIMLIVLISGWKYEGEVFIGMCFLFLFAIFAYFGLFYAMALLLFYLYKEKKARVVDKNAHYAHIQDLQIFRINS